MGVEYAPWFFVADPDWTGGLEAARRVHTVLEGWGLAGSHIVFDISSGKKRKVKKTLDKLSSCPANALVVYDDFAGVPSVADIMGPSLYGLDPIERYVQERRLVMGDEHRTIPMDEGIYVEVTSAEERYGKALGIGAWLPADTRPNTRVEASAPFPDGFDGIYRAGLCFDCGKDLPEIAEGTRVLPNPSIKLTLAEAFKAELIEVGIVY